MASRKLEDLHPILKEAFIKAEEKFQKDYPGIDVIVTCTYRSKNEQNELYAKGRTTQGPKVTNAKGGQSPHNYLPSYAFDVAFVVNGKLDWSTKYFNIFDDYIREVSDEVDWGGLWRTFKDLPHYELRGWKKMI